MASGETGRIMCNVWNCYEAPVGGPYGLPEGLAQNCVDDHNRAFQGHQARVVMHPEGSKK